MSKKLTQSHSLTTEQERQPFSYLEYTSYLVSREHHLNLNALMQEHFCGEITEETPQNQPSDAPVQPE